MPGIEIRNSRWESGAGAIASTGFALAGLAALAFVIHKAIVDPLARWAGESVKAPLLASLFLGGLALVVAFLAIVGIVYFLRRFLDQSVQLLIDEDGIECRRTSKRIRWADIADIQFSVAQNGYGSVIASGMALVLQSGGTISVSTFQLDMEHHLIHREVDRHWRSSRGK